MEIGVLFVHEYVLLLSGHVFDPLVRIEDFFVHVGEHVAVAAVFGRLCELGGLFLFGSKVAYFGLFRLLHGVHGEVNVVRFVARPSVHHHLFVKLFFVCFEGVSVLSFEFQLQLAVRLVNEFGKSVDVF